MATLINDLHLGVVRKSGVTPQSQEDLRTYIFANFKALLEASGGDDLIILGDLFDSFEIAPRDWVETYYALADWCDKSKGDRLILVAGNHDVSPKGSRVSSFEMLGKVLDKQFNNVIVVGINEVVSVKGGIHILAHCDNQDVFDMKLGGLLEGSEAGEFVLLHANLANPYAAQADHSLNLSEEVAKEFANKGVQLIFAHEHCGRVEIPHGAKEGCAPVVVLGNQIVTSISDCLGNAQKFYHTIRNGKIEKHSWWNAQNEDGYVELDWHSLDPSVNKKFIRVVGEATSNEASEVVDAIHKFRQKSSAFVIGNAVKVDGIVGVDELPEQFEAAKKFDVLSFIYSQLDEGESQVVRKIVEELE